MNYVGGQAVLEGVMMQGRQGVATSVRLADGSIHTKLEPTKYVKTAFSETPVLRGILSLWFALKRGIQTMDYSASLYSETETKPTKDRSFLGGKGHQLVRILELLASLALVLVIFTILPTLVARLILGEGGNRWLFNLIEAMVKIGVFLAYLLLLRRMPEIRRLYRYHGAEHQAIAAYERKQELTLANVRKASRYHARCGTNFLFLVIVVSILIASFVPVRDPLERMLINLLCLPLVAGLTFELLQWLGANQDGLARLISLPGRLMQRLTTAQPDDDMLEVAITALKRSEGIPHTVKELKEYGDRRLKGMESASLDRDLLIGHVTGWDRARIFTHPEAQVSNQQADRYKQLIEQRRRQTPMAHILGRKEFMGLDFIVTKDTLIPRPDTEILVEAAGEVLAELKAAKAIPQVLDLCTGSGAIGLSLLHRYGDLRMTLADISPAAIEVARRNARHLGVTINATFVVSDLFENIQSRDNFDLIVSNPPYISNSDWRSLPRNVKDYEPKTALVGGEDGLDFYRRIADKARQYITEGGHLMFEIGWDQGEAVSAILKEYAWQDPQILEDLAGRHRVVKAYWSSHW